MLEHPQYMMWKARYEAELATEREQAARRARQEATRAEWGEAWQNYKDRWREGQVGTARSRSHWWDIRGWFQFLFEKCRSATSA